MHGAIALGIILAFPTQSFDIDPEHVIPEGTIVDDRYRLDRLLGHGAMGAVYRGEHLSVGRRVAIKVLGAELSASPTIRKRFRAEARAASAAGHPNIIEVFDAGELPDGRPYLVMELLEGRELLAELREHGPLSPERAARIVRDVARALHAAHEVGIIHRDLKAENVFLTDRDGREAVKVLDFGIAHGGTDGQRVTTPGLAMGTPEYMAPEQAYGAPARPTFDIYALGVLLFELLVGEPPFVADNPIEILGKKASTPAPSVGERRRDLPDALVELVDECLALEPDRRPQTAADVARRLEAIALAPAAALQPAGSRRVLDTWGVLVAVGVVVLAFAGIAWAYASEDDLPGRTSLPPDELRSAVAPETEPEPEPEPQPEAEPEQGAVATLAPVPGHDEAEAVRVEPVPGEDANPEPHVAAPPSVEPDRDPDDDTRAAATTKVPRKARETDGDAPVHESATCQLRRRQAHEARGSQDWAGVLRYTKAKSCWESARERDKLRVKAYMERQQFDQCVALGGSSLDPEVRRWVRLCEKRKE